MNLLLTFRNILVVTVVTFVTLCGASLAVAQEDASDQAVTLFNHGQDLHEKGDLAGAVAEYDKALKLMPEFPEAEYQRAMAEIALGNLVEAEASLRRATDLRKDWSLAWGMLGDVLVRKSGSSSSDSQMYKDAESAISHAVELDPANAPAYAALVDLQINGGASREALSDTLVKIKVLTDGKSQPAASLWAGRAALERSLGDTKNAKLSLARAVEIDPKSISALTLSAEVALAENDVEKARQVVNTLASLKIRPEKIGMLNARIAAAEGRFPDAIATLDRLPTGTPGAEQLRKRINAATATEPAELEKQLASDPKNIEILNRLCSAYRRDIPLKALEYCRRASELEPTNMTPAAGYAAALVQARQFSAAAALLEKLVSIQPDNRTLHANYATALFELKRYDLAVKQFEWLSTSDPKAAAPYYFLAISYDQLQDYVDSLAAYEQYMKLADPVANKLEIEKVNLRLPTIRRLVKDGKGKKR